MVQLGRPATGASSNGTTTRNAASLSTGAEPGATVAFSVATHEVAAIARTGQSRQSGTLLFGCRERRLSNHVLHHC